MRVWQHDRAIEASVDASVRSDGVRQETERPHWQPDGEGRGATWKVRHAGGVETIRSHYDPARDGEDLGSRTYEDLKAMSRWLRAAGAQLVMVRYPIARDLVTVVLELAGDEPAPAGS